MPTPRSTSVTASGLLDALERRLAEISATMHALARERAVLQQQTAALRMGVLTPEAALVELRTQGLALTGVTPRLTRIGSRSRR
jgi:hypothetical protein